MRSNRTLYWCALVLTVIPSLATAAELSLVDWAKQRIEQGLLSPLAEREGKRSRFSRSRPMPHQRRVRIVQAAYSTDKSGRNFMPFAVDIRYGSDDWEKDDITGCVYQGSANIFIKVGEEYRPAAFLLGKNVDPVPNVCETAPAS
ncbi:MAG TPA: hypothetical protein VL137_17400 [Polyangiaceae bacterium]|jgi:hypothetical protein|nr:hypothetical protein [Polyangiaceae bacterium]